jgi:hypothetical protein
VALFYDAPTPSGVFEDFLAIPAAGGNASTKSFSNLIQSEAAQFDTNGFRLVVQSAVLEIWADLVCLASFMGMPQSPTILLLYSMLL